MAAHSTPPSPRAGGAAPSGRHTDLVLVDFDGTLAAGDVGNRFFRRFTDDLEAWDRLLARWRDEEITARECLAGECELARASRTEALAFADEHALAPDAEAFCHAARVAGVELIVASDGLGFYIERLLGRAGLAVTFHANTLRFEANGLVPVFRSDGPSIPMRGGRVARSPRHAPPGCGRCGNCKGAIVRAGRERGRRTVLIGDGYSDRCAAREAEVVYAKDDLLDWCRARGIPARPFATLSGVVEAEGWGTGAGGRAAAARPAERCR